MSAELSNADVIKQPLVRMPRLDEFLQPYYHVKNSARTNLGLRFGVQYTAFYQGTASPAAEHHNAASGRLVLASDWNILKNPAMPGTLVGRLEWRHRLGTEIAPADMASEIGSIVTTAYTFSDYGLGIPDLYWRQMFLTNRIELVFGQIDLTDYFDQWLLSNPNNAFVNGSFQYLQTIALPDQGLGALVTAMAADHWYVMAGFGDMNGAPNRVGFDTFFDEAEYFSGVEGGYISSYEDRATKNIHLTAWHASERTSQQIPDGWGLSGSVRWNFDERWLPFLSGGFSEGGASPIRASVSAGLGAKVRSHDAVGLAASWATPDDVTARDQYSMELFYRLHLTQHFELTPDIQIIVDPAYNTTEDVIALFGVRGRFTF